MGIRFAGAALMGLVLMAAFAGCDSEAKPKRDFKLEVVSVAFDYQPTGEPYSGFQVTWRITGGGLGSAVDEKSVTVPNAGSATFVEAFQIEERDWDYNTDVQTLGYGSTLTGDFYPAAVDGEDSDPLGFSILAHSPGAETVSNAAHLATYAIGGTVPKRGKSITYSVESLPEGVKIVVNGVEHFFPS